VTFHCKMWGEMQRKEKPVIEDGQGGSDVEQAWSVEGRHADLEILELVGWCTLVGGGASCTLPICVAARTTHSGDDYVHLATGGVKRSNYGILE